MVLRTPAQENVKLPSIALASSLSEAQTADAADEITSLLREKHKSN
jgi:hypothetical protein